MLFFAPFHPSGSANSTVLSPFTFKVTLTSALAGKLVCTSPAAPYPENHKT